MMGLIGMRRSASLDREHPQNMLLLMHTQVQQHCYGSRPAIVWVPVVAKSVHGEASIAAGGSKRQREQQQRKQRKKH